MVPWDQILNFLALRPNVGPTQTHAGYRCTPYDFLVHVDDVFFEDMFFVFQSFLHRCVSYIYVIPNRVVLDDKTFMRSIQNYL